MKEEIEEKKENLALKIIEEYFTQKGIYDKNQLKGKEELIIKLLKESDLSYRKIAQMGSQNYIAASNLIIAKAGWGTIAEAMRAGKKLVLIERPSAFDDPYNY